MTGDELGDAARTLFGDHAGALAMLAEVLGVPHGLAAKMAKGKSRIAPHTEAKVKELLAAAAMARAKLEGEDE